MSEQGPEQLSLPLPRGSLDYVSFAAHYQRPYGWVLKTWHRHAGDLPVCERKDVYESLTTQEMADIVCAVMGSANSQFYLRGGVCTPSGGDPEELRAAEPVVDAPVDIAPDGDLHPR